MDNFKQKLIGDDPFDMFGSAVSINDNGTILAMCGGPGVKLYTGNSVLGWKFKQLKTGESEEFGLNAFGQSVAMNGSGTLLMMGNTWDEEGGYAAGAALIYTGNSIDGWNFKQKLTGISNGDLGSFFGTSLATNKLGTILMMGGPSWSLYDTDIGSSLSNPGAAFIYTGNLTHGWTLKQILTGDLDNNEILLGKNIAINSDGNILLVGGADYSKIYTGNSNNGWQLKQKLTASNFDLNIFRQDQKVAINNDGSIIAMGGISDVTTNNLSFPYKVSIYTGTPTNNWVLRQELIGTIENESDISLDINGDGRVIVIGEPSDSTAGINAGASLIYVGDPVNGWALQEKFLGDGSPYNLGAGDIMPDYYGTSVSINDDGTILLMGGPGDDNIIPEDNIFGPTDAGGALVYLFEPSSSSSLNIFCETPTKIVAGRETVYALMPNGYITGWGGKGRYGLYSLPCYNLDKYDLFCDEQNSNQRPSCSLTDLQSLQGNIKDIAGGGSATFSVLTNDGQVYEYGLEVADVAMTNHGDAYPFVRGVNTLINPVVSIKERWKSTFALLQNGYLTGWGPSRDPGEQSDLLKIPQSIQGRVIDYQIGYYHMFVKLNDNTITGWGDNAFGNINFPQSINNDFINDYGDIINISCGRFSTFVTTTDGFVTGWGGSSFQPEFLDIPNQIQGWVNKIVVSDGLDNNGGVAALLTNNTVTGWGGFNKQLVPNNIQGSIIDLVGNNGYFIAKLNDGRITGWGINNNGQLNIPWSVCSGSYPDDQCLLLATKSFVYSENFNTVCKSSLFIDLYVNEACGFNIGCSLYQNLNLDLAEDGFYATTVSPTIVNPPPAIIYHVLNGLIVNISDCGSIGSSSSSSSIDISNSGCLSNYYATGDTTIEIINQAGEISDINNSWLVNSGIFYDYNYTGLFSSPDSAGVILNLNNDTEFFVTAGVSKNIFSGSFTGFSGFFTYLVNYYTSNPYDPESNFNRTKQQITIKQFRYKNTGYKATFAFDESWAEYDLSGLMNSNNAFSWSYNVVERMRISGIFYEEAANGLFNPIELHSRKYTPFLSKNLINYFDSFQTVCKYRIGCDEEIEEQDPGISLICWTGADVQGDDFKLWLRTKLEENIDLIGRPAEKAIDILDTVGIDLYFTTLSGYLLYNTWVTGEQIVWNLYNFDYTGTYKKWHLNNNPIYPSTGFTLTYPLHWNSIDSLVETLNNRLNNVSYPVWYPYPCTSGEFSGIFIDGPLMRFWKNTGTTGDGLPSRHVNNRIDFVSLRNLPQITIRNEFLAKKNELIEYAGGKSIDTGLSTQSIEPILDTSYRFEVRTFNQSFRGPQGYQGFKYLLPKNIVLEGLNRNTDLWESLDVIDFTEQYKNITEKDKIRVTINKFWSGTISDQEIAEFEDTGKLEPLGIEAFLETNCEYKDLFQFNKIEEINITNNIYCPPVRKETLVKFIWPNNCPPFAISGGKIVEVDNVFWCSPQPESLQKTICPEPVPIPCPEGFRSRKLSGDDLDVGECPYYTCEPTGIKPPEFEPIPTEVTMIRTGSNFSINAGFNDPFNNQENLQLFCGEDLLFKSYKKFRVRLVNFFMPQDVREIRGGGTAFGPKVLLPLYPQNKFYIQNINFSDAFNVPLSGHIGTPECLVGADYVIDVSGLVPIRFTGIYDVYITGKDEKNESGSFRFQNVQLIKRLEDEERPVKFNKVSGYIYEESGIAALNETIYASGNLCYNFDETPHYFYDPETTIVSFEKTLCTPDVYRTGIVTGSVVIVKPSVINKELLVGGRYNIPVDYYRVTQNSTVNGIIKNTLYRAYNVTGIYRSSGFITGIARNGVLETNVKPSIRPFN